MTKRSGSIDISVGGGEILGRCKHIANWIAAVRMHGVRTPTRVAAYIRKLVKAEYQAAVAAGKAKFPEPHLQALTQEECADGSGGDRSLDRWSDDETESDGRSEAP